MSRSIQSPFDPGRRQAIWLFAPSVLIVAAAILLLPWLVETRQRLDNDYWEGQLHFAAVALGIAASGVPFLILRWVKRVPYLCLLGWLVVASGYLALTLYIFQSHFPLVPQLVLGSLGLGCLLISIRGLASEMVWQRDPARPS